MAKDKYQLVTGTKGYRSKSDPTNTPADFLVSGSQNMIINDQERVETRAGYELFGAEDATTNAVKSKFSWKNSSEGDIFLREINGVLAWYSDTSSAWETLLTGLSTTKPVRFTPIWNGTELIDILLFVNNSTTLYEWSGGQATYKEDTSNTIVLNETVATSRFLTSGTRKVRIKDDAGDWKEFTYTNQSGSTLIGVTPDPTSENLTDGAICVQSVCANADKPSSDFTNDVIEVFENQLFVGSHTDQRLKVSSNTNYTSFSESSPRIAGEGANIILDATVVGMKPPGLPESDSETKMIVFCAQDRAYQVTFEISPGSTADREVPRVKPLPIASGQGAQSHELIEKVKGTIVWISNDNELLDLGTIMSEGFNATPISDPIKPDFIAASFLNGDVAFWRNFIGVTAPADGKLWIFDTSKGFWNPPQVMGMRGLSVYKNDLYGHSNSVSETYKLFTTLSDNSRPIAFKAHFAYRGAYKDMLRNYLKNFNKYFTELYIQSNTIVDVSVLYEWKGAKTTSSYQLDGSASEFLFTPVADASHGVNSLGTNPLGGLLVAGEDTPKHRRIKKLVLEDHFEYQTRFESDGGDHAWQILSHGNNVQLSNNLPATITK